MKNTRITLPPVFQNKLSVSDWDDARQYLGVERLAAELAKELNNAVKRIDNKIPEVAYAINRYNRQREAYATKFPNKEYQPNYGIVIAQSDENIWNCRTSVLKTKQILKITTQILKSVNKIYQKLTMMDQLVQVARNPMQNQSTNRRHLIKHLMINQLQPLRHPYLRPS